MRGKNHAITGILFLTIILTIDLFTGLKIYDIITKTNPAITILAIYTFFAGILLPDADKFGTWIFKFFLPFAITSYLIGLTISTIQGKKFKHRGFLHTNLGIIITSITTALIALLFSTIFVKPTIITGTIFFSSTIIGQIIHKLFD